MKTIWGKYIHIRKLQSSAYNVKHFRFCTKGLTPVHLAADSAYIFADRSLAMPDIRIERLTEADMQIPIDWAASEGWNPGLDDQASFYAADPGGFWGLWLQQRIIATISAVSYGADFGFVGFYIVDPDFRGQGYGRMIWDRALESMQVGCIGLDGVVEQQDFYRRSGFVLEHRNIRYEGRAGSPFPLDPRIIAEADTLQVLAYDKIHFAYDRPRFLQSWLDAPHSRLRIVYSEGKIKALGVIRQCRQGYKIGPLFANDASLAEMVLKALISSLPQGTCFYLDIPQPNEDARMLCQTYGMKPVFETARMYKGNAPQLPLKRIFGITSFELG